MLLPTVLYVDDDRCTPECLLCSLCSEASWQEKQGGNCLPAKFLQIRKFFFTKIQNFGLEIPHLGSEIEILSAHNLFCQKFGRVFSPQRCCLCWKTVFLHEHHRTVKYWHRIPSISNSVYHSLYIQCKIFITEKKAPC